LYSGELRGMFCICWLSSSRSWVSFGIVLRTLICSCSAALRAATAWACSFWARCEATIALRMSASSSRTYVFATFLRPFAFRTASASSARAGARQTTSAAGQMHASIADLVGGITAGWQAGQTIIHGQVQDHAGAPHVPIYD